MTHRYAKAVWFGDFSVSRPLRHCHKEQKAER
jgi:hypothetical protein